MKHLDIVWKYLVFPVDGKIWLQLLVLEPFSESETHEDEEV